MKRTIKISFVIWLTITGLIVAQSLWIYVRHGAAGFAAVTQDAPFTNTPIALACAAITWLLVGLLLAAIYTEKLDRSTALAWSGFFLVAVSYLNILRERVRYGDIDYYIQAAFTLAQNQPLPDTYLYPPLWATLLALLARFGEDTIFLVCWFANVISLCLFFYLLQRTLRMYGFGARTAALSTTVFMIANVAILRTLLYVQVNLHVMNLILLSLLLYRSKPLFSGLALAVAAHLKASPALLALAFILELNWTWLFGFGVSLVVIAGATVALHGLQPYYDLMHNLLLLNESRLLSLRDNSFDSAIGTTFAYLHINTVVTKIAVFLAKILTLIFALVLGLRARHWYGEGERGSRALNAVVPLGIAMTLASPLIWEHHGVFLVLPALLILRKLESPAEWACFGAIYVFEFLIPTIDYFPWSYARLLGMCMLLILFWIARQRADNGLLQQAEEKLNIQFGVKPA